MKRLFLLASMALSSAAIAAGPPELEAAIAAWAAPEPLPTYRYALTDLNGDGQMDAIVLALGPYYCGSGGCTMAIFKGTSDGFAAVSDASITREPIYVLTEVKSGWHTLSVHVAGGGAQPGQALLRFDGAKYPSNPSMQERASQTDLKTAQQLTLQ